MPGSSRPKLPPRLRKKRLTAGIASAGALAAYWAWLTKSVSSKPQLWVGEGDVKARVLPHCSLLLQPYSPAPLALNTHVQNILGFMRGATLHGRYTRQLVIAHDGGTLGLDWFNGCDAQRFGPSDSPVLMVMHGINGGSYEGYCKWVCAQALKRGWRAVVLNYRGCAGLPLTSPRGYAATLTHDVHYAITSIKGRFPTAPLFAVGYSLGGVLLTKYLAESDLGLHASLAATTFDGSGLVAAAVVSSPVCLVNSASNLGIPWTPNYLYNIALAYKLKKFMVEHEVEIRANTSLDIDTALGHWTVGAVEDVGIPQTFGFRNRQEYYEAVSSLKFIPQITTPTLFLVSKDDPFLGVLPDVECAANPNTLLAATERGGHVAFLTGLWPLGPAYMDAAVLQFLEEAWKRLPARQTACAATQQAEAGPLISSKPQPSSHSAWELESRGHWGQGVPRASDVAWLDAGVLPREAREPHVAVDWHKDTHSPHTSHSQQLAAANPTNATGLSPSLAESGSRHRASTAEQAEHPADAAVDEATSSQAHRQAQPWAAAPGTEAPHSPTCDAEPDMANASCTTACPNNSGLDVCITATGGAGAAAGQAAAAGAGTAAGAAAGAGAAERAGAAAAQAAAAGAAAGQAAAAGAAAGQAGAAEVRADEQLRGGSDANGQPLQLTAQTFVPQQEPQQQDQQQQQQQGMEADQPSQASAEHCSLQGTGTAAGVQLGREPACCQIAAPATSARSGCTSTGAVHTVPGNMLQVIWSKL